MKNLRDGKEEKEDPERLGYKKQKNQKERER